MEIDITKNVNAGKTKIENDLLALVDKDLEKVLKNINQLLQNTIENKFADYPQDVVDTGNLKENSFAIKKDLKRVKKIILKTDLKKVPYATDPYFGINGSEHLGPREYLKDTALRWKENLKK